MQIKLAFLRSLWYNDYIDKEVDPLLSFLNKASPYVVVVFFRGILPYEVN